MQWSKGSVLPSGQPWQLGTRVCGVAATRSSCANLETAQLNGWPLNTQAPDTLALKATWNWCAKSPAWPRPATATPPPPPWSICSVGRRITLIMAGGVTSTSRRRRRRSRRLRACVRMRMLRCVRSLRGARNRALEPRGGRPGHTGRITNRRNRETRRRKPRTTQLPKRTHSRTQAPE